MGDNPTFIFDEHRLQSNGPKIPSSDAITESDFHDPNFSLAVSPAIPRRDNLEDPGKTWSEVVSVKSRGSTHVVIKIGAGDRPGTGPIEHGESGVEPSSESRGRKTRPKGTNPGTSKDTNTDTSKGTSKRTSKGTSTGTKRKRAGLVVSQVTKDVNSAEQGDGKGKNGEGDDGGSSPSVDGNDPPWYAVTDEVNKSGKRGSVLSEANSGKRGSVLSEANSGRRESVLSKGNSGRRGSVLSEGNSGRRGSVLSETNSGRRASLLSESNHTASEGNGTEYEDEDGDEDAEDYEDDGSEQYYEEDEESEVGNMLYTIDDNPPWYLSMGLGFQHYLTMVGSTLTMPFILTPELCIQQDDPARGFILSTIFFVSGIVTFLQVTFGVRLPIVQGGSFAFFVPTLAILHTGFPACSTLDLSALTTAQRQEEWQSRMREIQGAIIAAALLEMLIGFSGLMGLLVSLITPLAIAPTVCLVGLALFDVAAEKAASHWGISVLTIMLMILFSQYLRNVKVPVPVYREDRGFFIVYANIFGLFPVLLSILLSWALCAILTATDVFPEGSAARTDTAGKLIEDSPWIRVPYPGQWGWPTVSAAGVLGILAALLASIVESVGDYYACARLSGAPPPPRHAINRGIGVEGIGCLIAGFWGTGNGTTSYSENIGAIGITKVGSRRVIQYGAGIMIVCGVLGKFGAVFVTIPEPVVGGMFCVIFAVISAVGLSSLQHVDLTSSRNLFVLGFPIFFGLALPKWLESNPDIIQSVKYPAMAQVVTVLLKTSMFVGGLLGIILDNTIPGTDKERGLHHIRGKMDYEDPSGVYDFPVGMGFIKRFKWLSNIPFCPTYRGWHFKKKE